MKNAFGISSLCMLLSAPAFADVNVISWGGSYGNALVESQVKPFQEKTGIRTTMTDSDNPAPLVKAMVEAGNVTSNVFDLESADAIRFCEEGLLERIDARSLPSGIDGTPAEEDFIPGALSDCGVGIISYGTIIAFDTTKFENPPQVAADFFDLEQFPGKRALRKSAKGNLELALIADGVPASEVYDILETDEGVDRAFAKLDTIKHDVVWWEAGQQAAQLLADGEVVMTTSFNSRIFAAIVDDGKPFSIIWDGQIYDFDIYVIPKGAPDLEEALAFISFATGSEPLASVASYVAVGPARKSGAALVGMSHDGKVNMADHMPSHPDNMQNAVASSYEYWVDHDIELNERFNAWLVAN